MKLLTHNLLKSNVKMAKSGYPLIIVPTKVEIQECEFNAEFIKSMLDRIEWTALCNAFAQMQPESKSALPKSIPEGELSEEFLKLVHHALLEVVLIEGVLQCPDSARKFKVDFGIPNMLLNEDEL